MGGRSCWRGSGARRIEEAEFNYITWTNTRVDGGDGGTRAREGPGSQDFAALGEESDIKGAHDLHGAGVVLRKDVNGDEAGIEIAVAIGIAGCLGRHEHGRELGIRGRGAYATFALVVFDAA